MCVVGRWVAWGGRGCVAVQMVLGDGWHRVGEVEGGIVQLVLRGAMGWLVWGSGVGVISLAGVHGGVEGGCCG